MNTRALTFLSVLAALLSALWTRESLAQVACCAPTACTIVTTTAACSALGGSPVGTSCSVCPLGACCAFPSNACTQRTSQFCSGGGQQFRGAGTTCTPIDFCLGACCNTTTGLCSLTPQQGCLFPTFAGYGTTCQNVACEAFGACCTASGTCTLVASSLCQTGSTWLGALTTCSPTNSCVASAPCCHRAAGQCVVLPINQCFGLGLSFGSAGGTCNVSVCPAPTIACCNGNACSIVQGTTCGAGRPVFGGVCTPTICCDADFNRSGAVTVQDVFEFLAAWFAGCT
jgi:hypothetical protein